MKGFAAGDGVNVDGFIGFSLSVQNRRKSRAGYSLENHLAQIFEDTFILPPLEQVQSSNVAVIRADGNQLEIEIRDPEFKFAVSGFDPQPRSRGSSHTAEVGA